MRLETIEGAKNNKIGGPDGIQNETLKVARDAKSPYLAKLFYEMVEGGCVPRYGMFCTSKVFEGTIIKTI